MRTRQLIRRVNWLGLAVPLGIVAVWQLIVAKDLVEYDYLPAPTEIAAAFGDLVESGAMGPDVAHTLSVTFVAAPIAIVLGMAIGTAVGLVPAIRMYFQASFDVLRTLPILALMPVALLIWGPAGKTEVIVASWAATWPMLVNTVGGVRSVHPRLRDVAWMFQLSRGVALRKIVLPSATPAILVGARLAVAVALVTAIVAEMVISSQGLGWGLIQSQQALKPAEMWAYAIVCGIVGWGLNALLVEAVQRALPGRRMALGGREV